MIRMATATQPLAAQPLPTPVGNVQLHKFRQPMALAAFHVQCAAVARGGCLSGGKDRGHDVVDASDEQHSDPCGVALSICYASHATWSSKLTLCRHSQRSRTRLVRSWRRPHLTRPHRHTPQRSRCCPRFAGPCAAISSGSVSSAVNPMVKSIRT